MNKARIEIENEVRKRKTGKYGYSYALLEQDLSISDPVCGRQYDYSYECLISSFFKTFSLTDRLRL
jgi:hypothetical protein